MRSFILNVYNLTVSITFVASASDFPPEQKYYPKWVLANEEDKKKLTRTPNYRPLLSIRAPGRRDLISFLMKEPVA